MALVIYTLGFIRLPLVCWLLFFCIIFFNFVFPQFFILRGYLCFFRVLKKKSVFPKKILKNTKNAEETFRVTKQ